MQTFHTAVNTAAETGDRTPFEVFLAGVQEPGVTIRVPQLDAPTEETQRQGTAEIRPCRFERGNQSVPPPARD
jgi:hypothetical protein